MTETIVDVDRNQNNNKVIADKKNGVCQTSQNILDEGGNVPLDLKQAFLLPAWYNEQKFRRGQKYFHDNYFSMFVAMLSGLVAVLSVPSILKVLILTGQSSHPLSAFRRYLDTLSHVLEWFDGDLQNPNSRASKSLLNIRARHCNATKKASKFGYGHISQRDMALTQFGFLGFALLRQRELGLKGSHKDIEGFVHFWRVIGYLIGIKDKYNLCQGDLNMTLTTCQDMLDRVFTKGLREPSAEFQHMSQALLDGMWALVPLINTQAFLAFTNLLCGFQGIQLTSAYSKFLLNLNIFMLSVVLNSVIGFIIRPILNFNLWLTVVVAQRFPYLAFMAFGRNVAAPQHYTIKSSIVAEQSH